jgi:hypothetical protein
MFELSKADFNFALLPYSKVFHYQKMITIHSLMMTTYYHKTTDGERAVEPFIKIFERAKRKNTTTIYSMEETNFFKI